MKKIECPHCGGAINAGALLAASQPMTKKRLAHLRRISKLGGWPKGKKRKTK